MSISALIASTGPIGGLDDDEKAALTELWKVWTEKLRGNMIRKQYYDQHNVLKDLGIAIPPHLTDLELVLGWPAKAVDVLARRCKLEKFVIPGVDDDAYGVQDAWLRNDMHIEMPQTIRSALKYSCSFLTATKGEVVDGEPDVLISSQSALYGSATWDSRRRRLKTALSITDMDYIGQVTGWALFMPGKTIRAMYNGGWTVQKYFHTLDRLPVEVLPYEPDLDRPFGCSRISKAVMGLSDSALRTLYRMEIHAEFFSSPQRYAMGADESMFVGPDGDPITQWQAILGRVWAAGRDPDTGDVPQLGQFAQSSPQPHTDQLRTLSAAFCAEASIPLSELGIVHDANPTSAEAIEAAERPLVQKARDTHDNFGPRIARAMITAVQIRDDLDVAPPELLGLSTLWRDPEEIPQSSAGDFLIKLVQAMPWLAESKIPLEQLGWDATTVERAFADKRRGSVATLLSRMTPQPPTTQTGQPDAGIGG